jgi:hypothetical protein
MKNSIFIILLWLSPIIIGGIIAAINSESVNSLTEKVEAWVRRTQGKLSKKQGWFYQYILNPIFWIVVKFSDWTDSFTHRGMKNGTRVAATLYLIVGWCFLLYILFVIVVILIVVGLILYVVFKLLSGSSQSDSRYQNTKSAHKCEDCENIDISGWGITSKGNGRCKECKGTGHDRLIEAAVGFVTLGIEDGKYDCKTCHGTGQCQTCGGTGLVYY